MRTILQALAGDPDDKKFRMSQNGVKYRTLCKQCNTWLGQEFDPTMNQLSKDVGAIVQSPLHLPPTMTIETKPHRLIRGIVGHMVAAKSDIDEVVFDAAVRAFIFDPALPIPDEIKIFYWVYPYPMQVVIRDILMPAKRGNFSEFMFCHVLKYFPIAFLATDATEYEGLAELTQHRNADPDDVIELQLSLRNTPDQHWPEVVDDGNILFGGQAIASSVVSAARPK